MQVKVRFRETGRVLGTFELPPSSMQGRHCRFHILPRMAVSPASESNDTVTVPVPESFDLRISEWDDGDGSRERCFLVDSVHPVVDFQSFSWSFAAIALRSEICRRHLAGIWGPTDERLHLIPDLWDIICQNGEWKREVEATVARWMNDPNQDFRDYEFRVRDIDLLAPRVPIAPAHFRRPDVHPALIDPNFLRDGPTYNAFQTLAENLNQLNLATREPGPQAIVQGMDFGTMEARVLAMMRATGEHGRLDVRLVGDPMDLSARSTHTPAKAEDTTEAPAPRVRRRCLDLG